MDLAGDDEWVAVSLVGMCSLLVLTSCGVNLIYCYRFSLFGFISLGPCEIMIFVETCILVVDDYITIFLLCLKLLSVAWTYICFGSPRV